MKKAAFRLCICITLLLSLGLLMVYNTTSAEVIDKSLEADTHVALLKQLIYAATGLFIGLFAYLLGYERICRLSPVILLLVTVLLALIFVPKVGLEINGAKRWLNIFGFSFQPSELAKFFIPIFFIHWKLKQEKITLKNFLKILLYIALPIILIFLEPDNGTFGIILSTLVIVFFLTKVNFKYWALPLIAVCTVASFLAYNMPHVRSRIDVYLHPELDLRGKGHQPYPHCKS